MYPNRWWLWASALILAWLLAGSAVAQTVVSRLNLVSGPERTRISLDLSQKVEPHTFLLADPYRTVIDLPQVAFRWAEALPTPADGPVAGFRHGQFRPGTSRLVVDLRQPMQIVQAQVLPPGGGQGWRLVLDLAPITREAFLAAIGTSSATAAVPPKPSPPTQDGQMPRRSDGRRTVILDPGHGGIDPGATGVGGIREKTLTLEIAQDLKRVLEASGRYHVVLTRTEDTFIRLRERIQIARQARGEIFLSLHADALSDTNFRGMTIYTLSDKASDAEAEALAQRENKAELIAGVDLTDEPPEVASILIDLAQRETMNLSARLAGHLVQELSKEAQLLRNGHRFAGFAVLKAPDVPSALVELGYLSNRQDSQQLVQPAYRRRLGQAILRALDQFFKSRPGGRAG